MNLEQLKAKLVTLQLQLAAMQATYFYQANNLTNQIAACVAAIEAAQSAPAKPAGS